MWWSDRRFFVLGGAAALAGCGFEPVYGPGGEANVLLSAVALDAPDDRHDQLFQQRIEERLGRASDARFRLKTVIETSTDGLGNTSDGRTTRFRVLGRAQFVLTDMTEEANVLTQGRITAFTGYSATGSTVATLAAERDADIRLMTMLADQVIDRLLIDAPKLA